jgi:hypothetical protein
MYLLRKWLNLVLFLMLNLILFISFFNVLLVLKALYLKKSSKPLRIANMHLQL